MGVGQEVDSNLTGQFYQSAIEKVKKFIDKYMPTSPMIISKKENGEWVSKTIESPMFDVEYKVEEPFVFVEFEDNNEKLQPISLDVFVQNLMKQAKQKQKDVHFYGSVQFWEENLDYTSDSDDYNNQDKMIDTGEFEVFYNETTQKYKISCFETDPNWQKCTKKVGVDFFEKKRNQVEEEKVPEEKSSKIEKIDDSKKRKRQEEKVKENKKMLLDDMITHFLHSDKTQDVNYFVSAYKELKNKNK